MLHSVKNLQRCSVIGADGAVGYAEDFYFDERWVVRYFAVNADRLRPQRRVLISPMSIAQTDWGARMINLSVTREQVERSPDIDIQNPIPRSYEERLHRHYRYPYYWGGAGMWGPVPHPAGLAALRTAERAPDEPSRDAAEPAHPIDTHLRSTYEVIRSHVRATDGDVGQIDDLLVDDENWAIRHVVLETGGSLAGKKILVDPERIIAVNRDTSTVSIDVPRESIDDAAPFDPNTLSERTPAAGQNVLP
jgi:hypothetical protein